MVRRFVEGGNLHVRTNGSKLHSLDFRVGDVFLEYHPLSPDEKASGTGFGAAAARKRRFVTDPVLGRRAVLYVFDDVDTLFGIVRDDPELRFYVRNPAF